MKIVTPWSIQVELTEGCNRLCSFCGLNGIVKKRGRSPRFMTMETAELLVSQCMEFIPTRRYEFAMHGEPTLNPNHLEIIRMFREYLPNAQIQITTNGYSILNHPHEAIDNLFKVAGVDFIVLDTYRPEREKLLVIAKQSGYNIIDTNKDCGITPYANHGRSVRDTIFLMDDLGEVSGQRKNRVIFNHAGSSGSEKPLDKPLEKTCTNVFREISVCYNGDVCACCMMFLHELVVGNIHTRTIKQIWDSEEFWAVRKVLYSKNRNFNPCNKCNYPGGMRQGLLENPGPPTDSDWEIIRRLSDVRD